MFLLLNCLYSSGATEKSTPTLKLSGSPKQRVTVDHKVDYLFSINALKIIIIPECNVHMAAWCTCLSRTRSKASRCTSGSRTRSR